MAKAGSDVSKCGILVLPECKRLLVHGKDLKTSQRRIAIVTWPKQNRNDSSLSCLLPGECALHLNPVTVIGGKEVCTHQQQENGGCFQVGVNVLYLISTRRNKPFMPQRNQALSLKQPQMDL